jgi:ATP-binding cassette subfamily C protein
MSITSGQHVAIIGPSGAGKTTLVDLMLGLIEPTSGRVTINGIDPRVLTDARPGLVSYVPQNPGLVSGTIAENIALGLDPDQIDYDKVQSAVRAAFLDEFIASLPDGIHTSVGKQGDALSGGQVQRLGLARALYEQPRLIILDEATSALDATSEAFVAQSLRNLGKNVTVVVIAHRLSTVQHSDVVYVVEDGSITASGTFSTLRKTVPMVAEYVKLMSFDKN